MSYPQDPSKQGGDPAYPPGHYPPPQYSHQLMQGGAPVAMHPQAQHYTYAQVPMQAYAYAQGYPGQQPGAPPPYVYQQPMQSAHEQQANLQQAYQQAYLQQAYLQQQQQPMYQAAAHAQFDSGARFDGIAGQRIPPAPPGCAPNAAQMATAMGGTVHAEQKKDNWLTGGKGGGMSFW